MHQTDKHIPILDGWRALSILCVLAGHWLPLGPSDWQFNSAVAAAGMALFFCLSGFLITQFLLADQRVGVFLIKRIFRIVPLAWLAVMILVIFNQVDVMVALGNFLFFANLTSDPLMTGGEHLWSLYVEMQFYIFMAFLVLVGGRKALFLVPVFTVIITGLRVYAGETISIVTWHRVDEIFIGGCVALAWNNQPVRNVLGKITPFASPILLAALMLASLPQTGSLGYARPYLAGATILASLYAFPAHLHKLWVSKIAGYIAQISYALYVVHGMLTVTFLGGHEASKVEKYLLRIPLILVTWLISHVSTFYYEKVANAWGRALVHKVSTDQPYRKSETLS